VQQSSPSRKSRLPRDCEEEKESGGSVPEELEGKTTERKGGKEEDDGGMREGRKGTDKGRLVERFTRIAHGIRIARVDEHADAVLEKRRDESSGVFGGALVVGAMRFCLSSLLRTGGTTARVFFQS
jgi:hypothetical protein